MSSPQQLPRAPDSRGLLRSAPVDGLGTFASVICAVHCSATALLPTTLVAIGSGSLLGHGFEWGFTLVAAGLAAAAGVVGWLKHRSLLPPLVFGAGVFGLLLSRFFEEAAGALGTVLAVLASCMLIAAHVANLRARRRATDE